MEDGGREIHKSQPPTSSLQPPASNLIAIWIDAHRGEVFAALYHADGSVLEAPTSLAPNATLDAWSTRLEGNTRLRFAGDGAAKYGAIVTARLGARAEIAMNTPALAGAIGRIAASEPTRLVNPHAVAPLYVRRSDAELARDRRAATKP